MQYIILFFVFSFSPLFSVFIEEVLDSDVFEVTDSFYYKRSCFLLIYDSWEKKYQLYRVSRFDPWVCPKLYPTLAVRYGEKRDWDTTKQLYPNLKEEDYGFSY